jgi:hypothetical protein
MTALVLWQCLSSLGRTTTSDAGLPPCAVFQSRRLVFLHIMKTGGLSVDALLRCRCGSYATPCALLREDGGAKHTSNSTGDMITRFRDSMLYGTLRCAGGSRCASAGIGTVPRGMTGAQISARAHGQKPSNYSRVQSALEAAGAPCSAQVLATHETIAAVQARPFWSDSHFVSSACHTRKNSHHPVCLLNL